MPQGLLSTPFAEVIVPPQASMRKLAALACALDARQERRLGRWLHPLTWNVIAGGRKPQWRCVSEERRSKMQRCIAADSHTR